MSGDPPEPVVPPPPRCGRRTFPDRDRLDALEARMAELLDDEPEGGGR
ncbi:hypothetical protein GCM10022243_19940 [Saccharothrix violaceirubra]|uniref:Uncharacterized protein n=1 Tax=Saccharothrix violaceirubra TaxID=413306 RepID=A0A7W7WVI6_9PSEU|nr:hypothetical protein [Saccharothrix violaceirubra]MBB4965101.1 hypothetical protein [Saccharothrix violaceirubra]